MLLVSPLIIITSRYCYSSYKIYKLLENEQHFTTSISCTSPHYPSHYHCSGGFVTPDGGSLEYKEVTTPLAEEAKGLRPIICFSWRLSSFIPTLDFTSQLTRGSLFFTSLTIFTDSSSRSSSKSSGSGGRTGSKFFWATVSCTDRTAWWGRKHTCWDYSADVQPSGSTRSSLTSARARELHQKWIFSLIWVQVKQPNTTGGEWNKSLCVTATKSPLIENVFTLRWGESSKFSSSFSSVLIEPLCSSSATCQSQYTWTLDVYTSNTHSLL